MCAFGVAPQIGAGWLTARQPLGNVMETPAYETTTELRLGVALSVGAPPQEAATPVKAAARAMGKVRRANSGGRMWDEWPWRPGINRPYCRAIADCAKRRPVRDHSGPVFRAVDRRQIPSGTGTFWQPGCPPEGRSDE